MASKAWYKPSALPKLIARFDPPPTAQDRPRKKAIEVWTTTCIVTNFGKRSDDSRDRDLSRLESPSHHPQCSTLINPANPNLSGPNTFAYFPRGGPQPAAQPTRHAHHIMGYTSQWGGMDVGNGMMFSAETIDGLVHQLGGMRLRAECGLVPAHEFAHAYANQQTTKQDVKEDDIVSNNQAKCPVGTAVMTSPGADELREHYDSIIHTTPPFFKHPPWETEELKSVLGIKEVSGQHSWSRELLRSCYRQSFSLAFEINSQMEDQNAGILQNQLRIFLGMGTPYNEQQLGKRVAVPLLGAGCRAFPKELTLETAALESTSWLAKIGNYDQQMQGASDDNAEMAVVFGLLEETDAETLSENIDKMLSGLT